MRSKISLEIDTAHIGVLDKLPWHKPLIDWKSRDAKFLQVKSGLSRHVVRFIKIRNASYAIKETSGETAAREIRTYDRLRQLGIPTLIPVGVVLRREEPVSSATNIGPQREQFSRGYVITQLLEYSIPHYYLFNRLFTKQNKHRIWDAIVRLFVQLHCAGVYWGDASLSNMMILFAKQEFPEIGLRTVLRAVLADAETVEIYPSISERLRMSDLDYFLESLQWAAYDARISRELDEPLLNDDDQKYILHRYHDLYKIEREEESFEQITKLDTDAFIGPFEVRGQAKALLQHIYEHKWYLSERQGKEVPIAIAAKDWHDTVFEPVLKLFAESEILKDFPDRTAASLYLDIMLHKHLMSEEEGHDVGIASAFESFAKKHAKAGAPPLRLNLIIRQLRKLPTFHWR
jgi:hypothetical protein